MEIAEAPAADAVDRIGRDVGRPKGAEGCVEAEPARGRTRAALAAVATGTARGVEQILAAGFRPGIVREGGATQGEEQQREDEGADGYRQAIGSVTSLKPSPVCVAVRKPRPLKGWFGSHGTGLRFGAEPAAGNGKISDSAA